jgi:hypothetical protein
MLGKMVGGTLVHFQGKFFKNVIIELSYDLAIAFLGVYLKQFKSAYNGDA